MLLGHWVKLEWLELMEMQTRATRIGFLETLAFPVVPVALAACHLPDVARAEGKGRAIRKTERARGRVSMSAGYCNRSKRSIVV